MSSDTTTKKKPNEWWVGVVCGMATFVDSGITAGVSTALVLYQLSDLNPDGLSGNQIGVLTAALTLGVAIGSLLGGRLSDKYGRHRVFVVTMFLIAIGSFLPVTSLHFAVMMLGISLLGLGVGADLPVALATISEFASDKNRGKILVFSNLLGGCGIGLAVGLAIAFGNRGVFGGQIIFGAFAAVAVVVLGLRFTIPESETWLMAQKEREEGIKTIRADKMHMVDLVRKPYRKPFLILVSYYTLVGIAVSVMSSFGTYAAYNIAGVSVAKWSAATMWSLPIAILAALAFMSVADTKFRMRYYTIGAAVVVFSIFIPVIFGFTFASLLTATLLITGAGAFCYETIMKVWTQESFPTMLRGSAQGFIYGISRFAMAGLNVVTPALLTMNAKGLYVGIGILAALGLFIGWAGFHKNARNEFHHEAELDPENAVEESGETFTVSAPAL